MTASTPLPNTHTASTWKRENIGARRLHTILEKILEDVAYEAPDIDEKHIVVNKEFVSGKLNDVVQNVDLSHYIL